MINTALFMAVASMLCVSETISAQACLAAPHAERGWLGARTARTSLKRYLFGAEAAMRIGDRTTMRAEADFAPFDDPTPARTRGRAGLVAASRNVALPVCLSASVALTKLGDLTVLAIPIGLVVGWVVPISGGRSSWTSRLEPRVAYRRASLNEFRDVSAAVSVIGGSGLSRGGVYGGVDFEWLPAEGRNWAVGIRAAVGF